MRILSRCADIFVANINALLDKAENPEAMIGQVIREMEEGLAVARGHAASAIAAERWLNRELAKQRVGIEFWQTKAKAAVAGNRDDLARVALTRKKELEISVAELAVQHMAAVETSTQARTSLDALETNLAVALSKQRSLIARHRAAQARRALCHAAGNPDVTHVLKKWNGALNRRQMSKRIAIRNGVQRHIDREPNRTRRPM